MGIMKLLGTSFSTILNGGNPTADRTVTFPDKDITVAGTNDVIGVGQTWQDVTASRVVGTTYTNNTGKPIVVQIYCYIHTLRIAGVRVAEASSAAQTLSMIVPNNTTYSVTTTGGGAIYANGWMELR